MAKGDSRPPRKLSAANKPPTSRSAAPGPAGSPPANGSTASPPASSPLLTSRTTTLDDPLTTSLLAEIARRPSTVEMSPAQIAAARAMAPGAPEPAHGEDRDPDRDRDDPA